MRPIALLVTAVWTALLLTVGTFFIIPTDSQPTKSPSRAPTRAPTRFPTRQPIRITAIQPTNLPTTVPTVDPTVQPTEEPTQAPTTAPTQYPVTRRPSVTPSSARPSLVPSTRRPTLRPTYRPSTRTPTRSPSVTIAPSPPPSFKPSFITKVPTRVPFLSPPTMPSYSKPPTSIPTSKPTAKPTAKPTFYKPSSRPTQRPTQLDIKVSFVVNQVLAGITLVDYQSNLQLSNGIFAAAAASCMNGITNNNILVTGQSVTSTRNEIKVTYTVSFGVSGDQRVAQAAYSSKSAQLLTYTTNGFFIYVAISLGQEYSSPMRFLTGTTLTVSPPTFLFVKSAAPSSSPPPDPFIGSPAYYGFIVSFAIGVPFAVAAVLLYYYRSQVYDRCFREKLQNGGRGRGKRRDLREVQFGTIVVPKAVMQRPQHNSDHNNSSNGNNNSGTNNNNIDSSNHRTLPIVTAVPMPKSKATLPSTRPAVLAHDGNDDDDDDDDDEESGDKKGTFDDFPDDYDTHNSAFVKGSQRLIEGERKYVLADEGADLPLSPTESSRSSYNYSSGNSNSVGTHHEYNANFGSPVPAIHSEIELENSVESDTGSDKE